MEEATIDDASTRVIPYLITIVIMLCFLCLHSICIMIMILSVRILIMPPFMSQPLAGVVFDIGSKSTFRPSLQPTVRIASSSMGQ